MPLELHSIDQFDFHKSPVYGICSIGNDIYSVGGDRQLLHYWKDGEDWLAEPIALLNHAGYACLAHDNWLFVGDAQGQLYQINRQEKSLIKIVQAHEGGIFKLLIHDDQIISVGQDGKLNIWKLDNLEMVRTMWISDQKLRDASWDDTSMKLALVGQDGVLRILHLPQLNELYTSHAAVDGLTSVTYWCEKQTWITSSKSGKIIFWKEHTTSPLFEFQAHKGNIYRLIADEQHGILWTASIDKSIKAWQLKDLTQAGKWENLGGIPMRSVNDIAIFHGDILISTGDNKKIDLSKICFSK
ncbi:MAG: hypothetical protein RL106_956 [Bacteroidota bacterium]|jgi:WD40 repeat protein